MVVCGRCGAQHDGSSVFCPGCGAVQAPAQSGQQPASAPPQPAAWGGPPWGATPPPPPPPPPVDPWTAGPAAQPWSTGAPPPAASGGWNGPVAPPPPPPSGGWTGPVPYGTAPVGPPPQRGRDPKVLLLVLGTVGLVVVAGVVAFLLLSRHGSSRTTVAAPSSTAPGGSSPSAGPGSSSTAPSSAGGSVTATPEAQPGSDAVPVPLVTTGADCSYPPGVDGNNQPVTYEPGKAVDGDPTTAWRCPGAGGHTIQLTLGETGYVTDLGLIPGYAKVDPATGVDRFTDNHTVTRVTWRITQGSQVFSVVQTIADPQPQLTWVHLSQPLAAASLSLTVTGTGNPGSRLDSTPISTIAVAGGLGTLKN